MNIILGSTLTFTLRSYLYTTNDGFIITLQRLAWFIRRHDRVIISGLVDLDRVAVECWIGKQLRRLPKIHNGEEEFVVSLIYASTAAYYLFEFGHRLDALVQNDQLTCLNVNAGR